MAIEYRCCGTGFLVRVGILILLVLFAGLMSGFKSLRLDDLEVTANSGTPDDRKRAAKILPVKKRRYLLFCTLSICNAAAMEALPIFLESLVPAWGAILISVTLILMFVEIVPQAVCSRHGLAIGAAVAPVVQLLIWICFPVAYPISKLMDHLSGKGPVPVDLHGNEHKHDVELFNREREEFMNKMLQERNEWFNKIQKEHEDFLLGIEMQKKELESGIEKRREEVESYLRDKEKAFELEKINELHRINSFNEKAVQELEQVALEMKKLDNARMEINIDREQRERERAVLNKSIEELKEQTQKLEKQRELSRAEREEVSAQVENLKMLEDLKLALDNIEVAEMQLSNMETSQRKLFALKCLKNNTSLSQDINLVSNERVDVISNGGGPDSYLKQKSSATLPSNSARLSWIKRCTNMIFKNSSEMPTVKGEAKSPMPDLEKMAISNAKLDSSSEYHMQNSKASEEFGKGEQNAFGQPKVILEVRPEDDIDKGLHSREPEIKEDSNERINHLISEQPSQNGKKRRAGAAPDDFVSPLPGQLKNNKKRRQVEKANADLSGNSINNTTHASMMEDQIHQNETEGGAEDTNILDVDKFIKITEVICEITKMDNIASEHPLRHQQSAQIPVEDIVEDEGTNGRVNSRNVGSSVSLCDLGFLDMEASQVSKEEQRENVGQSSGHDQSQEKLNKGGVTTEDPDGAGVVDASKDVDNVGARTRSKRKL